MDKNIFEINNKKLCAYCFSTVTTEEPCHDCVKNNGANVLNSLPAGTILHGKFIVGKAIYYDNSYYCYYGFDPEANERVLIRELFPAGGFCKRINKSLVCDFSDSAMALEFKTAVNNFHTEVKILSGIKDPAAVTSVRDLFDENGTTYSVISFPQNATLLSEYIKNNGGKLGSKESFRILDGIIKALDVIHKNELIHGNIRPENIILIDKKIILTGLNYGGYGYLENRSSPIYTELNRFASLEQLSKSDKRGPWTDIFALGSTLYYMLTGTYVENIFSRIDLLENDQKHSGITYTEDIPNKLVPILEKMLQIRIDDRYRNLSELTKSLTSAHLTKNKIKPSADKHKKSENNIVLTIVIVLILCFVAGATFMLWKNKDKIPEFIGNFDQIISDIFDKAKQPQEELPADENIENSENISEEVPETETPETETSEAETSEAETSETETSETEISETEISETEISETGTSEEETMEEENTDNSVPDEENQTEDSSEPEISDDNS